MLDVDRFKKVNDREGHLVGDAVLRQVAQRLQLALRPSDVVGRYGGEEFVVGLVEADAAAALAVAERIRRRVGEEPCGVAGSGVSVTVSLGVAERAAGEEDLTALLSRADAALYRAKRGGRDRVSVAATPAGAPARDPRRSGSSAHGGAHPAGGD
jgi:diguanylate cyclase (GGDEF)-like protein